MYDEGKLCGIKIHR